MQANAGWPAHLRRQVCSRIDECVAEAGDDWQTILRQMQKYCLTGNDILSPCMDNEGRMLRLFVSPRVIAPEREYRVMRRFPVDPQGLISKR
ncbi:hypothetical protein [Blastochloris tepida]|uniref:hypothetical protein n=1 Tax=Blastochloris tepida TaxID=2233851 RepID=UPI00135B12B3|nr:hypothetical protein [Blastochloris tepida]